MNFVSFEGSIHNLFGHFVLRFGLAILENSILVI